MSIKPGRLSDLNEPLTPNTKSSENAATDQATGIVKGNLDSKPTLIQELMEIRQRIVESGRPLLSWDEVNEEVARRRGEIE